MYICIYVYTYIYILIYVYIITIIYESEFHKYPEIPSPTPSESRYSRSSGAANFPRFVTPPIIPQDRLMRFWSHQIAKEK